MIFAVDFDGTLVENKYPEIGEPKLDIINFCKERQALGDIIILWTCRTGKYLTAAIDYMCEKHNLIFNHVNENAPWDHTLYDSESRKIGADYYIDDRAVSVYNINELKEKLNKMINNNNSSNENNFLSKTDKTIAINKAMTSKQLEEYLNNINSNMFQSNISLEDWKPYLGRCPHCGSANIEANYSMVLTTMPPQYICMCKDCNKGFYSGEIKVEPAQMLTLPKEPLTLIPGYISPEINKPNYSYGSNYGWICPRCGKVNAPHINFCDCNNGTYYPNIVYCNTSKTESEE